MESAAFIAKIEKIKMPVRIAILVGMVVVLGGLFVYLYEMPKQEELSKARESIAALETKLNQTKARAARIKQFQEELAQVDAQFQEALKLLPNTKEIPSLLKIITQLGVDSQLDFRLFSPQAERAKDFYMEIPVSIEVSGNYHNVAVFFDKVGAMERIVNIVNVSMNPDQTRPTNLMTKCDAVTYRFKGAADARETAKK